LPCIGENALPDAVGVTLEGVPECSPPVSAALIEKGTVGLSSPHALAAHATATATTTLFDLVSKRLNGRSDGRGDRPRGEGGAGAPPESGSEASAEQASAE
jgi:hypothetical protein